MSASERAVEALRAGELVVLPTDTVYGLCASASSEAAVRRLSELKGREPSQPVALLAGDVGTVLGLVPELRGRPEELLRALLPGPYTLVLPNPSRRFPWLAGSRGETIGVRVPVLGADAAAVLERAGAVAATSANLHGGVDPRSVAEIPAELLAAVAAVVDAGELPGAASTVVDFTGAKPRVLREGAGDASRALAAGASSIPRVD